MNAIILAAGLSSRFVPLCFEKPKGLLRVKGEVLIERQIRQLQEAGISDITVVVGYFAGKFKYLKDLFRVKIVKNEDYYRYNNSSSIFRVLNELEDTFICSSDNYFPVNVFKNAPGDGFYSAVYAKGKTDEYCLSVDDDDVITGVTIGGCGKWYMAGPAFFNKDFSEKFKLIFRKEYANEASRQLYWEDIYIRHITELPPLKIRRFRSSDIKEFDSLEELRKFDSTYCDNTGSVLFHNICRVLQCSDRDICDIHVLQKGMTNVSFSFLCCKDGKKYIYRHPGAGTSLFVDRKGEKEALQMAKILGLDSSFLFIHPVEGWKISSFIENAETLNPDMVQQCDNLTQIAHIFRRLHQAPVHLGKVFDLFAEIEKYDSRVDEANAKMYDGWANFKPRILEICRYLGLPKNRLCPCHNDPVPENFIKDESGTIHLLDWEYAGMNDPLADIASLFLEGGFSTESQNRFLQLYFEGHGPENIYIHILGYQILWDTLWALWTVIKEAFGNDFGSYGIDRFNRAQMNYARWSIQAR